MLRLLTLIALLQAADPAADFDRGRAFAAAGDAKAAAAAFERATRTFPTWGLAWLELADTLLKDGSNPPLLERALVNAQRLETTNPRAFRLSAEWHEQRGETLPALEAYQRALGLRPDQAELRGRIGLLLVQEGRFSEALAHLEAFLADHPDDRGLRLNLAEAYEKTGALKKAERELALVCEAAPASVLYRRRLAEFLERNGQKERAAEQFRRLDEKRPTKKMRPLPASKW